MPFSNIRNYYNFNFANKQNIRLCSRRRFANTNLIRLFKIIYYIYKRETTVNFKYNNTAIFV